MLTNYQEFLLEKRENELLDMLNESEFILSPDLLKIIDDIADEHDDDTQITRISKMFQYLDMTDIDTNMSYLDLTDENGMISFLNPEKAVKYRDENNLRDSDVFSKLKGNKIRLGRLIKKVADIYMKVNDIKPDTALGKRYNFTDKEIEDFVNLFKSYYDFKKNGSKNFELVSGERIKEIYNENNYFSNGGTLGGSCMRYDECQSYFDIYIENDVEVLVLWAPNKKVMGRAIVWKLTSGEKFMDRVYYNRDSDVNSFIKYAEENKFLYKEEQNSRANTLLLTPEDNYIDGVDKKIEVNCQKISIDDRSDSLFPYTDTLKYYYWREGKLRNWIDKSKYYVKLEDTDGWVICDECDNDGSQECSKCDGYGYVNCGECDGYGWLNCGECSGEGSMNCGNCDGSGIIEGIDGGETECPDCDGNGYTDCKNCSSSGHIDCNECEGDGSAPCSKCDIEGTFNCKQCGGFSDKYN